MNQDRHLSNYEQNDTIATGLVRPKTTAILFDKIWIPKDFRNPQSDYDFGYNDVPQSVCVEEVSDSITIFNIGLIDYNYPFINGTVGSNILKTKTTEERVELMKQNYPYEDGKGYNNKKRKVGFLFSQSRNLGIKQAVEDFKQFYNVELVPVYLGLTGFEKSLLAHDGVKTQFYLQNYRENALSNMYGPIKLKSVSEIQEFDKQTSHSAYEVCLSNIPTIVEEKLEWKQVLEMRKDDAEIGKIRRFRRWVDLELEGKNQKEISEYIAKALDDYKFALKKHGIMTVAGGTATVITAASTGIGAITGGISGQIAGGLSITSALITFTTEQLSELYTLRREPIALIYELEKKSTPLLERIKKELFKNIE